jgi:prepilin-type N-terminal cleavage/methylation domain-containing protein
MSKDQGLRNKNQLVMINKTSYKSQIISYKKNGYTLIEVIIAAVIFAILITVTMVTFGTNSNLQTKSETIQTTSLNAKYIAEAIARDIRLADVVNLDDCAVVDNQTRCKSIELQYGNDSIFYQFVLNNNIGQVNYLDQDIDESVKLNADNISIDEMYFIDEAPQVGLHIVFSVEGNKSVESFTQAIDTSVTTRNYPNFYDKFTPQLQ